MEWSSENVVDEVYLRLGNKSPSHLAKLLGVSKQTVCNWQRRNKVSEQYYREISRLTGIPLEELLAAPRASSSTMTVTEFVADVTRHIEAVRNGASLALTVNGKQVVKVTPA